MIFFVLQQEILEAVIRSFGIFRQVHQAVVPYDEFLIQMFSFVIELGRHPLTNAGQTPATGWDFRRHFF